MLAYWDVGGVENSSAACTDNWRTRLLPPKVAAAGVSGAMPCHLTINELKICSVSSSAAFWIVSPLAALLATSIPWKKFKNAFPAFHYHYLLDYLAPKEPGASAIT